MSVTSEGDDYSPLMHQVAGCHSGTPSNILVNKRGQIFKPYKPISNPTYDENAKFDGSNSDLLPVTLNELQFYTLLETSTEEDYVNLRKITPKYFGSKKIRGTDHLLLEDYTYDMKYPCVMDIKIGKDRYYPGRAEEKADMDNIKYPSLKEFGFCIAGIKMYAPLTGLVNFHFMPQVTRQFSSKEVAEHVKLFLHFEDPSSAALRKQLLNGTKSVLNWVLNQRSLHLRGSSILLVYDAADLASAEISTMNPLKAKVGMIDFAHVFHSFGKRDDNYLNGIYNLIHVLQNGELP